MIRASVCTTALLLFSASASYAGDVSPVEMLPYRVIDSAYSDAFESIVLVSAEPSFALHVVDPIAGTDIAIPLPIAPNCVGLSPGGTLAAVGHNGWVSIVDLASGVVTVTHGISTDVLDVVLASNGFVYGFPRFGQWERIRCVEIATGIETLHTGSSVRAGTRVAAHPNGLWIYGADNGLSPSDIEKYDISNGTAQRLYDSPYHGDFAMCGNLWISEDGLRIFTRCGNVFRSSALQSQDMIYNGAITGSGRLNSVVHSAETGVVAALWDSPGTTVDLYDYEFLVHDTTLQLPPVVLPSGTFATEGREVHMSSDGVRAFVVVQVEAASGALFDYGIVRITIDENCTGTSERYCPAVNHSGGAAARIDVTGSFAVGENATVLSISDAPAETFGVFIYGSQRGSLLLGEGRLCIEIFGSGIHRVPGVMLTDASGATATQLDFSALPLGARINGGSVQNFQFWFRDAGTSNLSDALTVEFCD